MRNAWEQGLLRAASIGFRPLESSPNGRGGLSFTRWELLEWSLVAVPANAEAVRALKSLNLLADDEPALHLADDEAVAELADVAQAMSEIGRSWLGWSGESFERRSHLKCGV